MSITLSYTENKFELKLIAGMLNIPQVRYCKTEEELLTDIQYILENNEVELHVTFDKSFSYNVSNKTLEEIKKL